MGWQFFKTLTFPLKKQRIQSHFNSSQLLSSSFFLLPPPPPPQHKIPLVLCRWRIFVHVVGEDVYFHFFFSSCDWYLNPTWAKYKENIQCATLLCVHTYVYTSTNSKLVAKVARRERERERQLNLFWVGWFCQPCCSSSIIKSAHYEDHTTPTIKNRATHPTQPCSLTGRAKQNSVCTSEWCWYSVNSAAKKISNFAHVAKSKLKYGASVISSSGSLRVIILNKCASRFLSWLVTFSRFLCYLSRHHDALLAHSALLPPIVFLHSLIILTHSGELHKDALCSLINTVLHSGTHWAV